MFAKISAGFREVCGLITSGAAYCWGDGSSGALGTGTTANGNVPVAVAGGLTFTSINTRGSHTCGVATSGSAYCWGSNANGELGDGTTTTRLSPVLVAGGNTFATVRPAGSATCGVTTAGAPYCWGSGRFGNGTPTGSTTPVSAMGGVSLATLDPGEGTHICGRQASGTAYCGDGINFYGEFGNGTISGGYNIFAVLGGLNFATLSTGSNTTCGVTTAGAAYCWGRNGNGQIGNGTTTQSSTPSAVAGGLSFASVSVSAVSEYFSCGLTTTGVAYCWGGNSSGVLGNGTNTGSTFPVKVSGQP